ncbi:chondroitinase-B domain-containing protein [Streptomyces niveiscabiei]|uniref:chondroitinase-B domain-containing protein n=1 Tax=Streptomyces niveiscabiei TaxID=164115 RepID=UPI0029AE9765|nr:chondroitinase-B domain-containing protein [Streptomyces niveiscabiei]MDX3387164.1 chondroitinase-B domain-containing protein [Streptomyces niveiscabiei]
MRRMLHALLVSAVAVGVPGVFHPVASAGTAPLEIKGVTASPDDGNVPANTLDDNLSTRWSSEGDGAWIRYDLGSARTVGSVSVAWHQGNSRKNTFDVQVSGDGSSWTTVVNRKVSGGGTLEQQSYDFADAPARYVRIVGHGNTVNDWTSITETDIYGADGGGGGGSCAYPADVLDLTNWYIGLPVGEEESPTNVYQPELATYAIDPWFVTTDDCAAVRFRAPVNGVTTSGSSNPRSELREMTDSGETKASWSSTSGTHTMVIDQAITTLPKEKPEVVAGQIHDASDDVSVFRLEDKKLYVTDGDEKHHKLVDDNYELGTRFQAKFVVSDGKIKAYYNGRLQTTLSKKFSGAYFKAGAYTQANCTNSKPCSGDNYGQVKIYDLKVTHGDGGDGGSGDSTEAAKRYGWGSPLPVSDEFDYTGPVDPAKWDVPSGSVGGTAQCWEGHSGNGRRCGKNSTVANGMLTMRGEDNGDTGWIRQNLDTRYGRWEIRSRSRNTGSQGEPYHPLHLIWPIEDNRLENGEYDWVEYSDPDAQCLTSFLHYPKSPSDKKERTDLCPVDMTQWHNFAFEWTPDALVGHVDGVEWFRYSGGANADRGNIQDMPLGNLVVQLDNFAENGNPRPAVFEVDWVRAYSAGPTGEDPTDPGGDSPLQVANTAASPDDGNVPANTLDNKLSTRWSSKGDGAWIRYDLGSAKTVGSVSAAWHQGDTRKNTFDVQLSDDGSAWKTVLSRKASSGSTLEQQKYDFADTSARYLRIVGHGNTVNDWTSITETDIYGADGGGDVEDPTDPTDPAPVRTVRVADSTALKSAFGDARPGDRIVLADGTYSIGKMTGKNGTAAQPITVVAENRGKAVIGDGQLEVAGSSYVTFQGLKFTNSSTLKLTGSNNVRLTRNHFRLTEESTLKWVIIQGENSHHNRIDHNLFEEKHQRGNFITIDGSETQQSQHDRIDHNHFRDIGPRAENEMEAIRVGQSSISRSSGFTVIESNLFERCDGDPEIVSVKSNDNIVRYNTFRASQGVLSQRHGNRSEFYGNFFLGQGKAGTGGIRVYGQDHKIYNNYFEGLTGTGYDAALQIDGGDVDTSGALSAHWRVYRATVVNNTFVDNVSNIEIGANYPLAPADSVIADNVITGSTGKLLNEVRKPQGMTYAGNIAWPTGSATVGLALPSGSVRAVDPLLASDGSLYWIGAGSPAIDTGTGGHAFVTDDMDGQARTGAIDAGADERSSTTATRTPLTATDVGPGAA